MTPQEVLNKAIEVAESERHPDYMRTVEMRKKLTALSSGENLRPFLAKYFPDSDDNELEKVESKTQSVTPAVFNRWMQPIYKATRSDITKRIETESELPEFMDTYYGARSLSAYLDTKWTSTFVHDPNAFEVQEWDSFDNLEGKAQPYPDLIACDHIHSFSEPNGELVWLMVNTPKEDTYRFYHEGYIVTLEKGDDPQALLNGSESDLTIKDDLNYSANVIETGIDEITAKRVGNERDIVTNYQTCISFVNAGLPRVEKLLKVGAEIDLVFNLHATLKKYVITQKCTGAENDICEAGCNRVGDTCTVCKGTGRLSTTSAKDVVEFVQARKHEENPDLEKMYHYEQIPTGIIDQQLEYQEFLETQCFKDVYNSTILQDYAGEKTAKEVSVDYEGIKDKLHTYEQAYSSTYKWHVRLAAKVREESVENVVCQFPMNLELEPTRQLILNRKNIEGCPSYVVQDHDLRLAERIYRDTPEEVDKFKQKQKYMPFSGKDLNTIKYIRSQGFVKDEDLALYDNFDTIWRILEDKDPLFYEKDNLEEILYKEAKNFIPETNALEPVDFGS